MIFFWELTNPSFTKYNFGDTDKRVRFTTFLDEQDVLYSYEIDYLKRHWITPHIKDDEVEIKVMEAFEDKEKSKD